MNNYLDTNGQPINASPTNDVSDDPRGEFTPDEANDWQRRIDDGNRVSVRFAELADADYWRDIKAAQINRRIAAALWRIGWPYDAARFDNIAFDLERSVERRRAQMYAQIESEMNA